MHREHQPDRRRDDARTEAYRLELQRVHTRPPAADDRGDRAVLLPILMLLLSEGADMRLLLALVYILL